MRVREIRKKGGEHEFVLVVYAQSFRLKGKKERKREKKMGGKERKKEEEGRGGKKRKGTKRRRRCENKDMCFQSNVGLTMFLTRNNE